MSSATAEPTLLFNWRPPRSRKRAIVLFVCVSALFHAVGFYLFQIVYPTTVVLLPPPARVSLITTASDEGRNMLRWIEAEDPALASAPQRPPEARYRQPSRTPHVPSYLLYHPVLKQVAPPPFEVRAPELNPPGPVPSAPPLPAPSLGKVPSRLTFSAELAGAGQPTLPPAEFTLAAKDAPEAIRFRVGVSPDGVVRFAFALNSSGDAALDQQARHYLNLARFVGAPEQTPAPGTTWGTATMEWGNDLNSPAAPREKPEHAPPASP